MSPKEEEKLRPFNLKHCILVKAVIWEYKNNKKLHSVGKISFLLSDIWELLKIMCILIVMRCSVSVFFPPGIYTCICMPFKKPSTLSLFSTHNGSEIVASVDGKAKR